MPHPRSNAERQAHIFSPTLKSFKTHVPKNKSRTWHKPSLQAANNLQRVFRGKRARVEAKSRRYGLRAVRVQKVSPGMSRTVSGRHSPFWLGHFMCRSIWTDSLRKLEKRPCASVYGFVLFSLSSRPCVACSPTAGNFKGEGSERSCPTTLLGGKDRGRSKQKSRRSGRAEVSPLPGRARNNPSAPASYSNLLDGNHRVSPAFARLQHHTFTPRKAVADTTNINLTPPTVLGMRPLCLSSVVCACLSFRQVWRGFLGRRVAADKRQRGQAATVLQRRLRGAQVDDWLICWLIQT